MHLISTLIVQRKFLGAFHHFLGGHFAYRPWTTTITVGSGQCDAAFFYFEYFCRLFAVVVIISIFCFVVFLFVGGGGGIGDNGLLVVFAIYFYSIHIGSTTKYKFPS